MSIKEFYASRKHAANRRRLYARIDSLPESTIRDELLIIAQRHELASH
ncbi:hypothetical protein [Mycobacterium sp. GA-2829]|nr:hypothetical protein [Mycobacterium sp. GA-2829]